MLLTAVSTVLGLIPITVTIFWGRMAIAAMGERLVATFLNLIFLPAFCHVVSHEGAPRGQLGGRSARPHRLGRSLNRGLPVRGDVSSRILRFGWCESVAAGMTIRGLKCMAKALLAGALAVPLAMLLASASRCETACPLVALAPAPQATASARRR